MLQSITECMIPTDLGALDMCTRTYSNVATPARSTTPSASLRVTIEQISTIIRSIIIHHSVIRCNVHDCIGYNEHAIMLHHYIRPLAPEHYEHTC